jgi:hypothetical protein
MIRRAVAALAIALVAIVSLPAPSQAAGAPRTLRIAVPNAETSFDPAFCADGPYVEIDETVKATSRR